LDLFEFWGREVVPSHTSGVSPNLIGRLRVCLPGSWSGSNTADNHVSRDTLVTAVDLLEAGKHDDLTFTIGSAATLPGHWEFSARKSFFGKAKPFRRDLRKAYVSSGQTRFTYREVKFRMIKLGTEFKWTNEIEMTLKFW